MVVVFIFYLFLVGKNERNKFFMNIYWENVDNFFIWNYLDSLYNFKILLL